MQADLQDSCVSKGNEGIGAIGKRPFFTLELV